MVEFYSSAYFINIPLSGHEIKLKENNRIEDNNPLLSNKGKLVVKATLVKDNNAVFFL